MFKRFLLSMVLFASVAVPSARADVLFAVDRETAGPDGVLDTQPGFTSWNSGSSITSNGITLTASGGAGFPGLRDRFNGPVPGGDVIAGDPFEALFRDFSQSTGTSNVNMTLTLSGLEMNTDYKVTLWGLDPVDNDGRGTSWYLGTDDTGPLLASFFNDNSNPPLPLGPVFSEVFNTGNATTLSFFGKGDVSAQGPPLGPPNTATVVVFNGL
jgi:hypothetical protein